MPIEQCYPFNLTSLASLAFDCIALDKNAPKYFGFAELISGLALVLVVWTIADLRYKFRIDTASLPVRGASLVIIPVIGVLTLLTDYWRSSQSRVPTGGWLTPESWQLLLGGSFLLVLIAWFWLAFFRPARFNRWNSAKFVKHVESHLLQGAPAELTIIGDELADSVSKLVAYSPGKSAPEKMTRAQVHALKLLLAIGSPKFCQAVVEGTPRLIINLFNAVGNQNKYSPEIDIIAKNIVTAAVENRRSFLYSEQDFYTSGLEGITRPVTTALCQNAQQIRNIGTLLSPDYSHKNAWDLEQWNAYFRLLLEAFKIHTRDSTTTTPASLQYSYRHIRQIYSDLNDNLQLNNLKYNDDLVLRLKALVSLILEMVAELDKIPRHNDTETHIARLIFNLIKAASSVRSPRRVAVEIQHKLVWEGILNSCQLRTDAGLRIQEHLYAMLLNAVKKSPNLDNVRLLGYCLNTLGFTPPHKNDEYGSTWRNLHMALIEWVKKDIAKLLNKYPRMARECFVDGMSYDEKNSRLVIHYEWGDGSASNDQYLNVEPYPIKQKILLSACLAGHRVRYNGTDKSCTTNLLQQWRDEGRLVTHCPELAAGLETPRLSAEMVNGQGIEVLNGRAQVLESDGRDVTQPYVLAAWLALKTAQSNGCRFAIRTDGSPTCGSQNVYDGSFRGMKVPGEGVAAALLREHGVEVFSESQLDALQQRLDEVEGA